MRITRKQIELMYQSTLDQGTEDYYLEAQVDGKLTFGAIETIERRKPIGLTAMAAAQRRAAKGRKVVSS